MKTFREKIATVLAYIYASGIAIALFVGGISFFGYVAALIAGGNTAATICEFIYKTLYPVIVYISSVSVLIGLLKMYVAGEKSMVPPKKNKQRGM